MADATKSHVPVVWKTNHSEADRLLGKVGMPVLDEVVEMLQQFAKENNWPLQQIDIRYQRDLEFLDWEEIHVIPVLRRSFDDAEKLMSSFLDQVDDFQNQLSEPKREVFLEMVGFGFETA